MMDIYWLLAEMRKRKASDLDIIAGSSILFPIDGRLVSAKGKKVALVRFSRKIWHECNPTSR